MAERAKFNAEIDRQLSELDAALGVSRAAALEESRVRLALLEEALTPREITRRVVDLTVALLKTTPYMKTPQIYEVVRAQGIQFTASNPEHRLVQILSSHKDIFNSDRALGWSLKGESPGATGLSGATESVTGQPTFRGLD